jgi:hypothetical protein
MAMGNLMLSIAESVGRGRGCYLQAPTGRRWRSGKQWARKEEERTMVDIREHPMDNNCSASKKGRCFLRPVQSDW